MLKEFSTSFPLSLCQAIHGGKVPLDEPFCFQVTVGGVCVPVDRSFVKTFGMTCVLLGLR